MPADTSPPGLMCNIDLKIRTIGNGYLVKVGGEPSPDDPLGQRYMTPETYIRDICEAPEVLRDVIDRMLRDQAARAMTGISDERLAKAVQATQKVKFVPLAEALVKEYEIVAKSSE